MQGREMEISRRRKERRILLFKFLQDISNRQKLIIKRRKLFNQVLLKKKMELERLIKLHQLQQINLLKKLNDPTILYESLFRVLSPKRLWMKVRTTTFWPAAVQNFTHTEWLEHFRISKSTFLKLCTLLNEQLKPKETILMPRTPISVEKQVAISLYTLGRFINFSQVGILFGVHKVTVRKCLHKFIHAVNQYMCSYIQMPTEDEIPDITKAFEATTNLPGILGCCDITHIPLKPQSRSKHNYQNSKGWHSIILQAVVDNQGR